MNKTRILILILLTFLLVAGTVLAAAPDIDWWGIGGGGSSVSQGNLVLDSVIGQKVIGITSQAGKELCSGFLCVAARTNMFMPLVKENNP